MDFSKDLSDIIDIEKPSLEELVPIIESSLKYNFLNVEVDVQPCPDLSSSPFNMTSKGFGKDLVIAEVGGPGNLFPQINKHKEFDIKDICSTCKTPDSFVFGPGAAPYGVVGCNAEMVADVNLEKNECKTKVALIDTSIDSYQQKTIDSPKFSLMANLAISKTEESQNMIHIKCSVRTGTLNFPETIRQGLGKHFGEKLVSLAGIFILREGKAKLHVMPDFPGCPFANLKEVDEWLRYFEMRAPLVCATVFHSTDPGYKLRLEHTHCFSEHGDAGHYHYDVTPETVCYEAWLAVAEKVYRIDKV